MAAYHLSKIHHLLRSKGLELDGEHLVRDRLIIARRLGLLWAEADRRGPLFSGPDRGHVVDILKWSPVLGYACSQLGRRRVVVLLAYKK